MSTYGYRCEHCPNKVEMTQTEFNTAGGRVVCDDCAERLSHVTTDRKLRMIQRTRVAAPACEDCGSTSSPRKHAKINPRNFREEHRLLCVPCGKKLKFQPVTFSRWSSHEHGREAAA